MDEYNEGVASEQFSTTDDKREEIKVKLRQYFDGKIECAVDGGRCSVGSESTILDMTVRPFRILRQGSLPKYELIKLLGEGKIQ